MSTIKTHIAQAIKIFGIMAIVAAFAAAAFPTRSFAAAPKLLFVIKLIISADARLAEMKVHAASSYAITTRLPSASSAA